MLNRLFTVKSTDTNCGFLPAAAPATKLIELTAFEAELNAIVANLPALVKDRQLRKRIDDLNTRYPMPELHLTKGDKAQKAAALRTLTTLAQAYVGENLAEPIKHVPKVIALPLYKLAKSKQRFPIITYSDYVLNNWQLIDADKELSLDNIKPITTITGTRDEEWFIMVHVAIEHKAAAAIQAARAAFVESQKENPDLNFLKEQLNTIKKSVNDCIDGMHKMYEQCNPDTFWDILRPFLSGWEKVKPLDCEHSGVVLEGIETRDKKPLALTGPSGAQSSIVPALDAALGVKHDIDGMHSKLLEFKQYMPNEHQAFIMQFTGSKIKHHAKHSGDNELTEAYDQTVGAVKRMRGAHLGLVHAYIYKPADARGIPREAITGTGGAPLDGYLGGRFSDMKKLSEQPNANSNKM